VGDIVLERTKIRSVVEEKGEVLPNTVLFSHGGRKKHRQELGTIRGAIRKKVGQNRTHPSRKRKEGPPGKERKESSKGIIGGSVFRGRGLDNVDSLLTTKGGKIL